MNSYHPYLRIAQSLSSIILPIMPSCKQYTSIQFFLLIKDKEERPMYINRLLLTQQVKSELKHHYEGKLFSTEISRGVKLSEAPGFGKPVYYHDKSSKGAKEYMSVANELAQRI